MLFANVRQFTNEIVTEHRQRLGLEAIIVELLEVDVVVRAIDVLQGQVGRVTPAIRFPGQESDTFGIGRLAHKGREVRRQRRQRKLVDQPVAFIIPSGDISRKKTARERQRATQNVSLHEAECCERVVSTIKLGADRKTDFVNGANSSQ